MSMQLDTRTKEEIAWACAPYERALVAPVGGQTVYVMRFGPDSPPAPRYNYIQGEWIEVPFPKQ